MQGWCVFQDGVGLERQHSAFRFKRFHVRRPPAMEKPIRRHTRKGESYVQTWSAGSRCHSSVIGKTKGSDRFSTENGACSFPAFPVARAASEITVAPLLAATASGVLDKSPERGQNYSHHGAPATLYSDLRARGDRAP